jgi:hypothetical protein
MNIEQIEEVAEGVAVELDETPEVEVETNESDVEIAEEISDASVTKAAIESETQIELARINAELETMRIKMEEKREKEWTTTAEEFREAISALTNKVTELEKMGASIPATLTDQVAEIAEEVSEAEAANNLTQQFMSPPTSETKTEATLKSEDGKEAKATVKTTRKRRLI